MTAPTILVTGATGATGNVGAPLVDLLAEAGGAAVRVGLRDPGRAARARPSWPPPAR